MAWETLKTAVAAVIKTNGTGTITGQVLQDIINLNLIPQLGKDRYKGVAVPATAPGTPQNEEYYFAYTAGTYANFGGAVLTDGFAILIYTAGAWQKNQIDLSPYAKTDKVIGIDKYLSDLFTAQIINNSFGHDVSTGVLVTDSGWVELIQSNILGVLTSFKLPSFTGGNIAGIIVVLGTDKKIKIKKDVIFTGITTDLTGYNINIEVGDYVGFYSTNITSILKYNNAAGAGSGLAAFTSSNTIGTAVVVNGVTAGWSLNYYWTVKNTTYIDKKVNISDFNTLSQTASVNNSLLDIYKNPNAKIYTYGNNVSAGNDLVNTLYCASEKFTGKGGLISSITLCNPAPANGTIKIAVCTVVSDVATINSIYTLDFLAGATTIDLSSYNIAINKGQSIAVTGNNTGVITWDYTGGNKAYNFAAQTIGSTSTGVANIRLNFKVTVTNEDLSLSEVKKLNVDNANTLVILGSSFSESLVVPNGFGWQERINDMCDIPIVNAALGGKEIIYNIFQVATGERLPHDASGTVKKCNPTFIFWLNSANGTLTGYSGMNQLKQAYTATLRAGAKMLLGTEEYWYDGGLAHDQKIKSFAYENEIPFSALEKLFTKLYPSAVYAGFNYAGHGGWRNISAYVKHYDDIIKNLPVNKSIKMFRPRPTFKAGTPVIADLVYDTISQRFEKFVAISAGNGTQNSTDTGNLDNIDNHSFAVTGGINTGIATSEVSIMMRGGDLAFTKFALIEFILDQINIGKATFTIYCDVAPTTLYVATINDSQYTLTTAASLATSFVSVPFTYVNGIVTADLSGNIFQYDKVRVIIEKSGTFNLSYPELKWFNATEKLIHNVKFIDRKFGAELISNTDLATNWTLSGATIKSLPPAIAQYSGFNAINSHAELAADGDYVTRTITITQPTTKVALRVVAQCFHKIATTRFNSDATTLNSGYIANNAPQVLPYDFDYGKIQIIANNGLYYEKYVMQGWHEIYLEIPVLESDTSISIKVLKASTIDASYTNAGKPILIHNISLQKIG